MQIIKDFRDKNIRGAILGLSLIFGAHFVAAQTAPVSDAAILRQSRALLAETATGSGPGVAVLVARGNKTIFRSARGMANIELGVPLSANHVFRIASITKMFVAALVIKLSENGELSLD